METFPPGCKPFHRGGNLPTRVETSNWFETFPPGIDLPTCESIVMLRNSIYFYDSLPFWVETFPTGWKRFKNQVKRFPPGGKVFTRVERFEPGEKVSTQVGRSPPRVGRFPPGWEGFHPGGKVSNQVKRFPPGCKVFPPGCSLSPCQDICYIWCQISRLQRYPCGQ